MKTMRYIGRQHPELFGKTAFVMPILPDGGPPLLSIRAQFDDPIVSPSGLRWGLGWHMLPLSDFEDAIPPRDERQQLSDMSGGDYARLRDANWPRHLGPEPRT